MSNKLKLQEHATDLQSILGTINALPEAGMDAYAVIAVTYPEGSVCTCSNGSETLELDNTVGYGFFLVPEAGTWTVTSTANDGTNTATQTVEITAEGQSVSVTLSFELVLFSDGVAAPELGEFSIYSSTGNSGLSDGLLKIGGDTYSKDNLAFQGAINPVSLGYKTLFVKVSTSSKGCTFGFSSDSTTKSSAPTWVASGTFEKGLTDAVASCPVDAVNTDSYLRIISAGGGSRSYDYISKIWLE